jgi:hypothetical protein
MAEPAPVSESESGGEELRASEIVLFHGRDPGMSDLHRHRLGRARRDQRTGRRGLELLRDRMRQDAVALADLLDDVAERRELGWQRRSGEGLEPQFPDIPTMSALNAQVSPGKLRLRLRGGGAPRVR